MAFLFLIGFSKSVRSIGRAKFREKTLINLNKSLNNPFKSLEHLLKKAPSFVNSSSSLEKSDSCSKPLS